MKAAIYIRVSTQLQATDRQRTELTEYAALKGYTITEIYEDMMSGFNSDRPSYNRLKEDAKLNKFDIVLFSEMSRMTRKNILLSEVDYFKGNNCQVYFQKQNIHVTNQANDLGSTILLSVMSAISGYEVALMKERTLSGKIENCKKRPMRNGRSPYGYSADKGRLVVDKVQADHVIDALTKYASGWHITDLCSYMRNLTGRSWTATTIAKIINNPIYRGHYIITLGGQCINRYYPELTIVSDELYEAAKQAQAINKRSNKRKSTTLSAREYILNDLLFCPECNRTIRGKYQTNGLSYICAGKNNSHRQNGRMCESSASYSVKQLESIIWNVVKFASVKANNTVNTAEQIKQTEALISDLGTQLGLNNSKLKELDTDLNNYIKRAIKYNLPDSAIDEYNDDIQTNKAQVNNNIASLSERLKSAKKQLNNLLKAGDEVSVRALIQQAENDTQLKKQYLHEYIDSIRIWSVNGYNIAEIVSNVFNKNIVIWKKYQKGNVRYYEGDQAEMLPIVFREGLFYDQDSDVEVSMSEVLDLMTENVASVS